jgi:hypothetical protein
MARDGLPRRQRAAAGLRTTTGGTPFLRGSGESPAGGIKKECQITRLPDHSGE